MYGGKKMTNFLADWYEDVTDYQEKNNKKQPPRRKTNDISTETIY